MAGHPQSQAKKSVFSNSIKIGLGGTAIHIYAIRYPCRVQLWSGLEIQTLSESSKVEVELISFSSLLTLIVELPICRQQQLYKPLFPWQNLRLRLVDQYPVHGFVKNVYMNRTLERKSELRGFYIFEIYTLRKFPTSKGIILSLLLLVRPDSTQLLYWTLEISSHVRVLHKVISQRRLSILNDFWNLNCLSCACNFFCIQSPFSQLRSFRKRPGANINFR